MSAGVIFFSLSKYMDLVINLHKLLCIYKLLSHANTEALTSHPENVKASVDDLKCTVRELAPAHMTKCP